MNKCKRKFNKKAEEFDEKLNSSNFALLGNLLLHSTYSGESLDGFEKIVKNGNFDDIIKGASGAGLNKMLMNELAESGVKYNVDDVVMITKNSDGKLLWLEKGTDSSGLKHIIDGKATNFADRGITDIPKFLEETLKTKPVRIGSNSKGNYAEYIMNGKEYTVAYGTNGYIVSFYPSGN